MTAARADPLAAAAAGLRELAMDLRERGDLASYRRAVDALVLVLGGENVTILDTGSASGHAGTMTISEYAQVTGAKPGALRRAAREGRIPAAKHGGVWLLEVTR